MFLADPDIRNASTLAAFLEGCGAGSYEELTDRANSDPEWFWTRMLEHAGIRLSRPYERLRDISEGPESIRWGVGGALNLTDTWCRSSRASHRMPSSPA